MNSHFKILAVIGLMLIVTAHRLPAPIQEESTPTPRPEESAKAKPKRTIKPKVSDDKASSVQRPTPEPPRAPVAGTWSGYWDNSQGYSGRVTVRLAEGPGGTITGDAGGAEIENGHRTSNNVMYTFHRGGRDYEVTLNLSADGTTMSGGYKVTQGQKLLYTGTYATFKRR